MVISLNPNYSKDVIWNFKLQFGIIHKMTHEWIALNLQKQRSNSSVKTRARQIKAVAILLKRTTLIMVSTHGKPLSICLSCVLLIY